MAQSQKARYNYIRSPQRPDHLYVFETNDLNSAELALVTSLQGLTSKDKPQIYIIPNNYDAYRKYLVYMEREHNVKNTRTKDVWGLVEKLAKYYEGYILYQVSTPSGEGSRNISINVATSLCGIKKALLIDKSLEEKAQSLGIKKIADVCDKDYDWLVAQPEYNEMAKNVVVELEPYHSFTSKLRDYAIMCNSICYYDVDEPHTPLRAKILADCDPDSPVLGWGSGNKGEDKFIDPTSAAGMFYVAANHGFNMSVLSSFIVETAVRQKNHQAAPKKAEKGKHYVTIVMSDGDNLQYAMAGFEMNGLLYDSDLRGKVDISWGIPSSMVDLAPAAMEAIYDAASDGSTPDKPGKDYFVTYSAGGYIYPSRYPKHLIGKHAEKLSENMKRADATILGVIDFDQYNYDCIDLWDNFTMQDGIDAVFYVDYCSYYTDTDQMLWSNGKPVIASKARFWEGLPNSDIDFISKKINSAPTDPSDPNTYSLIMVHCWSKYVKDVVELVKAFDEHVEIVTTETFVQMIKDNVDRTKNNGIGVKSLNTTYLSVPLDLGNYQYPADESKSTDVEIDHNCRYTYEGVANSIAGIRSGTKVTYKAPEATYKKIFLNRPDIFIGTTFDVGIYSEDETPKKIAVKFYNSEKHDYFNFTKELTITHKGWKFFSVKIPSDLLAVDTFEIKAADNGGYSLTFGEMVLRYKNNSDVPDMVNVLTGKTVSVSIEEFSLSGAIFYNVIEKQN